MHCGSSFSSRRRKNRKKVEIKKLHRAHGENPAALPIIRKPSAPQTSNIVTITAIYRRYPPSPPVTSATPFFQPLRSSAARCIQSRRVAPDAMVQEHPLLRWQNQVMMSCGEFIGKTIEHQRICTHNGHPRVADK